MVGRKAWETLLEGQRFGVSQIQVRAAPLGRASLMPGRAADQLSAFFPDQNRGRIGIGRHHGRHH